MKLRDLDQKTLFETLGIVEIDLFAGDPKQTDKTKELYEFIKQIMEPEPAKRASAHQLLKNLIFEKPEEDTADPAAAAAAAPAAAAAAAPAAAAT